MSPYPCLPACLRRTWNPIERADPGGSITAVTTTRHQPPMRLWPIPPKLATLPVGGAVTRFDSHCLARLGAVLHHGGGHANQPVLAGDEPQGGGKAGGGWPPTAIDRGSGRAGSLQAGLYPGGLSRLAAAGPGWWWTRAASCGW